MLVWRADPQDIPAAARRLGIEVVSSVQQGLDVLAERDVTPAPPPGVVDRVRRLLGFAEPTHA